MAQEVIDIGAAPNDGLGDPLRTAFSKTNNNFSQLFAAGGVSGIANGSSSVNIPQSNGNVVISSAGTANVLTVTGTGANVVGTLNSTGLATLANLSVTGTTVSTGTIQSLADVTAVTITASGNSSANNAVVSNLITVGQLSLTGNIVSATVTGNVVGGNLTTNGVVTATGNITGGNVITAGQVSATGNITAAFFTGNGAGLTGVVASGNVGAASKLLNGTSEMNIPVANGNIIGNVSGVTNVFTLTTGGLDIAGVVSASGNVRGGNLNTAGIVSAGGNIVTTANVSGGNILTGGLISATGNIAGGNILTSGLISATGGLSTGTISASGNITGDNLRTGGLISATGTVTGSSLLGTVTSVTGNVTGGNVLTGGLISATANVTGGNLRTGGLISATGNVTGGNLSVGTGTVSLGNIVNSNANAVGNIGSPSNYFNQVFAQATTALYADLAEVYAADAEYAPGTVVSFGGHSEITKSVTSGDPRVAGVISENPSYLMNSGLQAQHCATVALTGRVPTSVIGPVTKGDMMVSAGNGQAMACATPAMGTVIGKALNNFSGASGTIEIVVGRM